MKGFCLAFALLLAAAPVHAQRAKGAMECKPTGTDFVFECVIRLEHAGKPLAGAQVTVGADMPSMPMAHNIRPARAAAGKEPGEYRAKLDLEMLGEWAVKLRLEGPVKDQLILNFRFDEKGAHPVKPGEAPHRH